MKFIKRFATTKLNLWLLLQIESMMKANITPLYKKKDKLNKDNYRSINLLSALSKILENIISN